MNDFDEAYDEDDAVFGEPYPALIVRLASRAPGPLLDLGCGQGRNAVALAALGFAVTAVDSSTIGVRQTVDAAARGGHTVQGVVADLTTFRIVEDYDVVLLDMVLHSLETEAERRHVLTEVVGAVRPGGLAYVVVPDPGPLVAEITAALGPWPTEAHEVAHRLTSGPHAGEYTFQAVVAERPQ